jgi:hypothetical protein
MKVLKRKMRFPYPIYRIKLPKQEFLSAKTLCHEICALFQALFFLKMIIKRDRSFLGSQSKKMFYRPGSLMFSFKQQILLRVIYSIDNILVTVI